MAFTDRLHNRGSISGFDIDNSLKLEADNTEYLTRTPSSAGNERTWTWSGWVKYTEPTLSPQTIFAGGSTAGGDSGNWGIFNFRLDAGQATLNTANVSIRNSTGRFRDPSAWYHFVVAVDTTQSTASNRVKVYLNGSQITDFAQSSNPVQNEDMGVNNTEPQTIGKRSNSNDRYFSGYMANLQLVDGTALTPTSFGEYDEDSGIWKPKQYTGSYGTNGYWLKFNDASSLGADSSGNGNNFTLNNITSADQATDTPTNNFCTLNPLNAAYNGGGNVEYTEGATKGKSLQMDEPSSGSMAVTQGKWYFEAKGVLDSDIMVGWGEPNQWGRHTNNPGNDSHSFAVHNIGRVYYYGNTYVEFSPSVSFDTTDIISCALDADNGFCYWAKNGTWMNGGVPTSGSTGTGGFNYLSGSTGANIEIVAGDHLIPAFRTNYNTNSGIRLNFGGYTTISISSAASDANGYGTFEYAPPSGYYALCTKNLAEYG